LIGTMANAGAIVLGGLAGAYLHKSVSPRVSETLTQAMGLAIMLVGLQMALKTESMLLLIVGVIIGSAIGEAVDIERMLGALGAWLESKVGGGEGRIAKAFVTASLIYCVGAMAIVGSIEEGLNQNHTILFAKATLDGVLSLVLSSTMGVGVVFSAIPIILYQGSITLLAEAFKTILTGAVIREMSAAGGLLVVGIGTNLLGVKNVRVGNMLPSIFVVVILALLVQKLGYPL
jgi:uncharacterized membrane protein YqgA involved in biofilm formation